MILEAQTMISHNLSFIGGEMVGRYRSATGTTDTISIFYGLASRSRRHRFREHNVLTPSAEIGAAALDGLGDAKNVHFGGLSVLAF